MNTENLILLTDSYKLTHWNMYPENTEVVLSYFESRNGAKYNKTVFFGLQYIIKKYLMQGITQQDIEEGEMFTVAHLGDKKYFNRAMWQHIVDNHGGKLPVEIKAVAEGTPVDVSNVMMTVENTDPKCAPLTNILETLLTHVWGPSTVATLSREVKILCSHYLKETCGNQDGLEFMLHDFGFRGVNQLEASAIAGNGHIINFMGTDTPPAMLCAHEYYGAPLEGLAYSVPATEHSIMTSRGEEGEREVLARLLKEYPTGILSIVIDSYNYRRFILEYAREFKDEILARDGKVVFRPDSGDPVSVAIEVLECLEEVFGTTKNHLGFKVLNPKVGAIWGDGIDYVGIRSILFAMKNNFWAASNIVFGMGGGLLQKINRDTQRFAFKSCAQKRDGVWHDIWKKPLDASKASKKGRLMLTQQSDGSFATIKQNTKAEGQEDFLRTVFLNGELCNEITFAEVRANAWMK